ncbi:hypothetical protein BDZ97DRAFT_1922222 [Flammula alnicola]|nr:hypothetical protein BDZ97DRAFT_1922222 [Flammula alnicola]
MKRGFLNSNKAKKHSLYPDTPNPEAPVGVASQSGAVQPITASKIKPGSDCSASATGKSTVIQSPAPPLASKFSLAMFQQYGVEPLFNSMTIATIPPRMTVSGQCDSLEDTDGHAEFISYANTPIPKRLAKAGYPKPVPKTPHLNYVIQSTLNMGQGVFAARDIKAYELVFAERPILITHVGGHPIYVGEKSGPVPPETSVVLDKYMIAFRTEWEKQLEGALGRMKEEDRKAYLGLVSTVRGFGPLGGRVQTNAFGVIIEEAKVADPSKAKRYSAIGKVSSRINHSCMPNVIQRFSVDSFCLTFNAVRDIKKGEQIFYSYTGVYQPGAARQQALSLYNFTCTCPACTEATPDLDKFRTEYIGRVTALFRFRDQHLQSPMITEQALQPVYRFKEWCLKAKICDTVSIDEVVFHTLEKINERKGNHEEAARYREMKRLVVSLASMCYDDA